MNEFVCFSPYYIINYYHIEIIGKKTKKNRLIIECEKNTKHKEQEQKKKRNIYD